MWSLWCVVLLVIGVQSVPRNYHSSLVPENECLGEHNIDMKEIHGKNSSTSPELLGNYLMCVWRKRHIVDADLHIDSKNIARYFYDIYFKLNLTELEKNQIQDALKVCEQEHGDEEYELGINLKDCMFRVAKSLPFLTRKVSE